MPSLVPVDHDPFNGETSNLQLAPVDYDPFAAEKFANPAVKGVIGSLATLPQRAIQNSQYSLDTGHYDPGPTLEAATLPMGTGAIAGVPVRAGEAVLGSGAIRKLPTDNYLAPISKHTDTLYREMSPSEALADLPTSVAHGGNGPMGIAKKFYADNPDMALGQGSNKGVRVQYDSSPFEGQINQKKPAWDLAYQSGMAEYLASPKVGANIRDAVQKFEIDTGSLSRVETAQYQRILNNLKERGWAVEKGKDKITASAPRLAPVDHDPFQ